jgi:catechol 2,3-dioxygenase-like lactoylglutathione lyase family enzyme
MKRMHVHVSVGDLDQSIRFYETLFGAPPSVVKPDYAKWMLDDPRVNFAISDRGRAPGVDHLGIQVENGEELVEIRERLKAAGDIPRDQTAAVCCYAQSDKAWVNDPAGVRWETFFTFGAAPIYGFDESDVVDEGPKSACCPAAETTKACC